MLRQFCRILDSTGRREQTDGNGTAVCMTADRLHRRTPLYHSRSFMAQRLDRVHAGGRASGERPECSRSLAHPETARTLSACSGDERQARYMKVDPAGQAVPCITRRECPLNLRKTQFFDNRSVTCKNPAHRQGRRISPNLLQNSRIEQTRGDGSGWHGCCHVPVSAMHHPGMRLVNRAWQGPQDNTCDLRAGQGVCSPGRFLSGRHHDASIRPLPCGWKQGPGSPEEAPSTEIDHKKETHP